MLSRCFMVVSLRACEGVVRVGAGDQGRCASEKNDGGKEWELSLSAGVDYGSESGWSAKEAKSRTGKIDRGPVN